MVDMYASREYPQPRNFLKDTEAAVNCINDLKTRKDIDIAALARTINKKPRIITNIIEVATDELFRFASGEKMPKRGAYRALVPIIPDNPNGNGSEERIDRLLLRERYDSEWRNSLFGILNWHSTSLEQIKKHEWNMIVAALGDFVHIESSIFANEEKSKRYQNEIGGGGVSLGNYMIMHMKWDTPYRKVWHNDQNRRIHITQ